jgi:hypothetical protein
MPEILIAAATGIAIGYHLGLDKGAKRLLALIDAYRRKTEEP